MKNPVPAVTGNVEPKAESPRVVLLLKLHSIMRDVGVIEKDATNEFHKYKYASEFAIKSAINPLLIKYKVLFYLEVIGSTKTVDITDAQFKFYFVDTESGEELTGMFAGSGQDKGDKGLYKAITGAIKYVLTSTFLIPTGDDAENGADTEIKTRQIATPVASVSNKCIHCGATGNYHSPKCPNHKGV